MLEALTHSLREHYHGLPAGLQGAVLVLRRSHMWLRAGVVFVHVPRSGGTSINLALYGQFMGHYRACDVRRWGSRNVRALPSFAVTRNPWDRLVSAYRFARRGHGVGGLFEAAVRRPHQYRQPEFDTFERFVTDWLAVKDIRKLDLVFRPQIDFVSDGDGNILVDHVGRLDRLGPTIEFLEQRVGNVPPISIANRSGEDRDYRDYYSPEIARIVGEIYREDVEKFGFEFDDVRK